MALSHKYPSTKKSGYTDARAGSLRHRQSKTPSQATHLFGEDRLQSYDKSGGGWFLEGDNGVILGFTHRILAQFLFGLVALPSKHRLGVAFQKKAYKVAIWGETVADAGVALNFPLQSIPLQRIGLFGPAHG